MQESSLHFIDGVLQDQVSPVLAFENKAFQWGESVFTTAEYHEGILAFGKEHLERLEKSAEWLWGQSLPSPKILESLSQCAAQLKSRTRLRISLFKSEENLHVLMSAYAFPKNEVELTLKSETTPVKLQSKPNYVKLGFYAEVMRLKRLACSELALFDEHNLLKESTVSNMILYHQANKEWHTPLLNDGYLKGIGLRAGLEGLSIKDKDIPLHKVSEYSEVYLVNSLRGIQPVIKWDEKTLEQTHQSTLMDCFETNRKRKGIVVYE